MTAIAYRNGVMAGDTLCIYNDKYKVYESKVWKYRGHLFGASGDCPTQDDMQQWYFARKNRKEPLDKKDFRLLVVKPDASVVQWESLHGFKDIVTSEYWAIGCGADVCMGAMFVGATSEEAVLAAIRWSDGCGGEVTSIRLGK